MLNAVSFSTTIVRQYLETKHLPKADRMKSAENQNASLLTSLPKIVSRGEWQWAGDLLRIREKATMRGREALSAERHRLLPPLSSSC
jgi:hypothetical protein